MDFTVIKRAGITQGEFAFLVGVSRVTTNLWVRGKMSPHRYTKAKIAAILGHLESALEAGDLPVSAGIHNRIAVLRAAVKSAVLRAKHVAQAEAAPASAPASAA